MVAAESLLQARPRYTIEEYLELERGSEESEMLMAAEILAHENEHLQRN